jgi:hypothetical protein
MLHVGVYNSIRGCSHFVQGIYINKRETKRDMRIVSTSATPDVSGSCPQNALETVSVDSVIGLIISLTMKGYMA